MTRAVAQPIHVLAKPVGPKCNLDCGYCYYLDKDAQYPPRHRFRMDEATLSRFIRQYIAAQSTAGLREITFDWQGGEPTLLGLDYFRRIVALQDRHCPPGHRISNSIQTNGTLISDAWAQFLAGQGFLVGLSIDGPPQLHDAARPDRRGRPSSGAVLRGLDRLLAAGVAVNLLTVVSKANVAQPLETYRYLRGLGTPWLQFIPALERIMPDGSRAGPPGKVDRGAMVAPFCATPEEYGAFLCAIWDAWLAHDVGRVFVQHFDQMLGLWMGRPASLCIFAETCGSALALEHDGSLYACDHYVYPGHRLGNIKARPLAELAALPRQRRFGKAKADLSDTCRACQWRFACNGGCPKHRIHTAPDGRGIDYFCAAQRMFLGHAAPALNRMAALIRAGRPAAEVRVEFPATT